MVKPPAPRTSSSRRNASSCSWRKPTDEAAFVNQSEGEIAHHYGTTAPRAANIVGYTFEW